MKHKLINSTQIGFLKKKGTEEAIAMLINLFYENLEPCNPKIDTFLDYSKAFDNVDHNSFIDSFSISTIYLQYTVT